MAVSPTNNFYRVLSDAIADLTENGFDSAERLADWMARIRAAAVASMTPQYVLERTLNEAMKAIYERQVERGTILKYHPGVARFTLEKVKPRLRAELDRRILASAQLIKLNRQQSIERTLQRFSGWATSIPPGGSDAVNKTAAKAPIRKALASLPFEERRVLIDQGHKFVSNLNNIIASDGGALAAEWHSHWRQRNYHFRPDHKERDERFYIVRGNWAIERGLMKPDGHQYLDEITQPGEEIFCRCFVRFVYSIRSIPSGCITTLGRQELARVQIAA